jgi:hypothetical protein
MAKHQELTFAPRPVRQDPRGDLPPCTTRGYLPTPSFYCIIVEFSFISRLCELHTPPLLLFFYNTCSRPSRIPNPLHTRPCLLSALSISHTLISLDAVRSNVSDVSRPLPTASMSTIVTSIYSCSLRIHEKLTFF